MSNGLEKKIQRRVVSERTREETEKIGQGESSCSRCSRRKKKMIRSSLSRFFSTQFSILHNSPSERKPLPGPARQHGPGEREEATEVLFLRASS